LAAFRSPALVLPAAVADHGAVVVGRRHGLGHVELRRHWRRRVHPDTIGRRATAVEEVRRAVHHEDDVRRPFGRKAFLTRPVASLFDARRDTVVDDISVDNISVNDILVNDVSVNDFLVNDILVSDIPFNYISVYKIMVKDVLFNNVLVNNISINNISVNDASIGDILVIDVSVHDTLVEIAIDDAVVDAAVNVVVRGGGADDVAVVGGVSLAVVSTLLPLTWNRNNFLFAF
jgi:hypothetical protein